MKENAGFLGSVRIIAVCTLCSRVTGLARDIALNVAFGQNWVQDAFNYGFLVPNLFRRLFGEGALSAVFVPTFTEVLDKRGKPAAWVLLGRVTGLLALMLIALTIVMELGALAIWYFAPGGPMRDLQIGLTAVMVPFLIAVCLLALFASILNCLNHFTVPALMPIVLNLMIVFGVAVVGPMMSDKLEVRAYGVASCVLAASVLQLLMIMPVLRAHGVRFRMSLKIDDPDLRKMGRIFIPVLLGQGILLFNVFFDAQVCTLLTQGPDQASTFTFMSRAYHYPLAEGALSAVSNAQRLYQFPLGVLAISLATAALPLFSLYASRGDMKGLRSAVAQALRLAVFVGLPSGVMVVVLSEPIITLLFQHGRFEYADTVRAAAVLDLYGIGIVAFCCQHIVLRGFYSVKDTITPMKVSCYLVAINIAMNLTLLWHPAIREKAFGISTTTTAFIHVGISMFLLRRRLGGRIGARAISASFLKTLIAGAAAGAVAWWLLAKCMGIDAAAVGEAMARTVRVFVPLVAAMIVFFAIARLLRMQELGWLFSRERRVAKADRDTQAEA